jgi:PAS domain S-box-containing protein
LSKRRFISIFRKQLLVACLFALLLATGTSIYQFFSDLGQVEDQADATLQQIMLTTTAPLEKLLHQENLGGAAEHLDNLFTFPPILSIQLLNRQNEELINLRRLSVPAAPTWSERYLFDPIHTHLFQIGEKSGEGPNWTLKLETDTARIPNNHNDNLAAIILNNFILCFVLTLGFHSLLHTLFTRQIIRLTNQLNSIRGDADKNVQLEVDLSHQNDEMGLLAETINSLWYSRQELQKNLAAHNKFVTTVTAISPVGLFRTDTTGDLIWYNQKARALLGILGYEKSLNEWLGHLHPDHQTEVLHTWQSALKAEKPFRAEFPLCLSEEKMRWVIGEAIPSWSDGVFEGYVGTLTDVTPLKQATARLLDSEERYHSITQNANSAIILTDANGRINYWNPAAETIFGYSRGQVLNENFASLLIPEKNQRSFAEACPKFDNNHKKNAGQLIELEARAKNGTLVPVAMSLSSFKMDNTWHAAMFISDISKRIASEKERVNLLDQLRQSQKMEAVGTLAGGIAHDFNNILTPIIGFAQLLEIKFSEESKERDHIDKILSSANRAKDLVGQILSFSRKSKDEAQPTLIVPVIKESLKLLRAGIPATVSIKARIPSTDYWILADQTRIHQILMNLATNAVQAMGTAGGTLTIALDQITATTEDYPQLAAGPYLRIQVGDTGCGIDQFTLKRIFDPYFTTKGADSGTGLGLSVVQSSVASSGGCIEVESEIGRGSTFNVLLPLLSGEFQNGAENQYALHRGSGQHLLLVDDEMSLVNIGREFLEDMGYQVTGTTSSREALEMIEKNPNLFDLLLTDQTMPQLTGLELARETRKLRPDMPILICTGQPNLLAEAELEETDILKVLGKPDIFHELADTLKEIFDGGGIETAPRKEEIEELSLWSQAPPTG